MNRYFLIFVILNIYVNIIIVFGNDKGGAKGGKNGAEESIVKTITPELCEHNAFHGDETNESYEFIPECGSCLYRAAALGQKCYENTWTFKMYCYCDGVNHDECWCNRIPNLAFYVAIGILPVILIGTIVTIKSCKKASGCPLNTWDKLIEAEKRKRAAEKKKIEQEENGAGIVLGTRQGTRQGSGAHTRTRTGTVTNG